MDGPVMSKACSRQIGPRGTVALCGVQRAKTVKAVLGRKDYRGMVYCVEAAPEAAERLRRELAPYRRVKVIHAALCATNAKTTTFHLNKSAVSSSLVCRKDTIASITVPVLTLGALVARTGPLDCLVLDIEGAEYDVLMAMGEGLAGRIMGICAELHPNLWPVPEGKDGLLTHLARLGWELSLAGTEARPELSAVRGVKRDTGWQRFHDPTHPCYAALRARFAWVKSHILPPSFLDIGCSNGVGLLVASEVSGMTHLMGVDPSLASVLEARASLYEADVKALVDVGVAESLPYADAAFSTAFLGEVLEHADDPEKALAEAVRVVHQGGTIIITVPLGGQVTAQHKRVYSEASLTAAMQAAGIDLVEIVTMPSGRIIPWLCAVGRNTRGK